MPGGLEPPHVSLPFTRRLMGGLRPVGQVPMLPVSNVGDHDSFTEEHGRESLALWLNKDIDDYAV